DALLLRDVSHLAPSATSTLLRPSDIPRRQSRGTPPAHRTGLARNARTCETGRVSALPFDNSYRHGFVRVSASTMPVRLADPAENARAILDELALLHDEAVAVAVFPELSLTGYSVEDLVLQTTLLDAAEEAIDTLVTASRELLPLFFVGAPLRHRNRLYNCAIAIHRGEILGVVPKSHLPTYREFYERRWYASGADEAG